MAQKRNNYTFRDLAPSFSTHPVTGDVVCKSDVYSILQAIKNLLGFKRGDVLMSPEIDLGLGNLLFEINDAFARYNVESKITEAITLYEPRVELQSVTVLPMTNPNAVSIRIRFYVLNQEESVDEVVTIERTR